LTTATATADGEPTIRLDRAANAPDGWDDLVAADGSTDYPHAAHWTESAARALPGATALWLTARREGRLVAGLAAVQQRAGRGPLARRRLDSSVEGTSAGPLVAADLSQPEQEALARALLRAYRSLRPGPLGAVALALGPDRERRLGPLLGGPGGWTRHASPTAVIDLAGGAGFVERERLAMTKRNERNRGLRRGALVTATREAADLAAYYPLYAAAAAHWGVRPTPLDFLEALLADPRERVFFTCVRLEGRVIGGHLNLHLGDRVFAWNGVTDPACARTHFPATLCFWGDIVEACRRGARWLDVGASGGQASLEGFKRFFGAELQERGYYVDEGAALRLARTIGGRARAGRGERRSGARWHDGRTGAPLKGGDA
jgi:CelD/BcsL family acetyltransferase involved in cellulose biosynthesis